MSEKGEKRNGEYDVELLRERGKREKESLNGKREVGNIRVHVKGKSEANRETDEEQEGREEERKERGKDGKKNTE
jgi:hypothetical protein